MMLNLYFSNHTKPAQQMDEAQRLAREWGAGYKKFVCALCHKKPVLLAMVMDALGQEEGQLLLHMWTLNYMGSSALISASEGEIEETHRLTKEWCAGQKNFVMSMCQKKEPLLALVMDELGDAEGQDLFHMWVMDNLISGTSHEEKPHK